MSIPNRHITDVKICILAPIIEVTALTQEEFMGEMDELFGGTMYRLVDKRRAAFRQDFAFERVVFDMRCVQDVNIDHIIRLLRQVSTTLFLKRKKAGTGRGLKFEVAGVDDKKKAELERAFPELAMAGSRSGC